MASEISHVVYAARVLTYLGPNIKDPAYWAGTLFPNIRHLNIQSRHLTHPAKVGVSSLTGKNDFLTGMRVHAWIDATQGQYLDMQHSKETLPWHPLVAQAFKLLEDEVVYPKFDDWGLIRRVLMKVREDELWYVDARLAVQSWHSAVQDYIRQGPNDASRLAYMQALGVASASGHEINALISRLKADARTMHVMKGFWQHLERLLR